MKFLIVDTYYPGFLKSFYKDNKTDNLGYREHKDLLLKQFFGTSDFYSYNLEKIGQEAEDLIINDQKLQLKWAKENGVKVKAGGIWSKIQMLPYIHRFIGRPDWMQKISLEQIKKIKPDVVYMQDLSALNPDTLKEVKKICKILIGQIACPLPSQENLKQFDLILTSFPHYVERFRKMGIKSEYFKISFDQRVLNKVGENKRIYDVVFIGSFSPHHIEGTKIMEKIAREVKADFWGYGAESLPISSPIRKNFHGEAWGLNMYKILSQSKIVINRHISVAENYANNMRLYESTGMGAMLITDHKDNLDDLFKIDKEVIAYKNIDELIKKIRFYLKNEKKREQVAKEGQKRTLKDYSYEKRMKELINIIDKYLKNER